MRRILATLTLSLVVTVLLQAQDSGSATTATLQPLALSPDAPAPATMASVPLVAHAPRSAHWAVLPHQWRGARLWSAWGDAIWGADDRVYLSIGDHGTPYGTTYVYQLDPATHQVRLVVDVNAVVGLSDKTKYAPGKIHGPLLDAGDGGVYIATYHGSVRHTAPEEGYAGDWLLRYDPAADSTANLGIAVPHCSPVAMRLHAPTRTIIGLAVFGTSMPEPRTNRFFAYSLDQKQLVFSTPSPSRMNRAILLSAEGVAYVADGDGRLQRWKAGDTALTPTQLKLPGDGKLRAAAPAPRPDGTLVGITNDGIVFILDPATETLRELGPNLPAAAGRPYTAVCRLSPDGRYLYYMPSAHGKSSLHGSALMRYDLDQNRAETIAYLHAPLLDAATYNTGGTYSLALNPGGTRLAVLLNGGAPDAKTKDFGICSVLLLDLPPTSAKE